MLETSSDWRNYTVKTLWSRVVFCSFRGVSSAVWSRVWPLVSAVFSIFYRFHCSEMQLSEQHFKQRWLFRKLHGANSDVLSENVSSMSEFVRGRRCIVGSSRPSGHVLCSQEIFHNEIYNRPRREGLQNTPLLQYKQDFHLNCVHRRHSSAGAPQVLAH